MADTVEIFAFIGKKVRVVNRSGQAWFVANDIGKVLGLTNIRMTVKTVLQDDECTYVELPVTNFYTNGGKTRKLVAINKSGLYALIMRSTRPEAKAFRYWVTHDVLPSIEATGSYTLPSSKQIGSGQEEAKTPVISGSYSYNASIKTPRISVILSVFTKEPLQEAERMKFYKILDEYVED